MGYLVVRHYPTILFAKAADHSYVECGTGLQGWKCWGGKTGGNFLRSGQGSTRRAHDIAEPDEKGQITCYLINGVCHQAANRILDPAGITVDGVRGYSLSVSLFGLLGRPRGAFGLCKAPFDRHAGVTGDLQQCLGTNAIGPGDSDKSDQHQRDFQDLRYMEDAKRMYEDYNNSIPGAFELGQFKLWVNHKFLRRAVRLSTGSYANLMLARERFEEARAHAEGDLAESSDMLAFAATFDELTLQFQRDASEAMGNKDYETLFDMSPEEQIVLTDPEIIKSYGSRPRGGGATA